MQLPVPDVDGIHLRRAALDRAPRRAHGAPPAGPPCLPGNRRPRPTPRRSPRALRSGWLPGPAAPARYRAAGGPPCSMAQWFNGTTAQLDDPPGLVFLAAAFLVVPALLAGAFLVAAFFVAVAFLA